MTTKELTHENFDNAVDGTGIVFVDFWAVWCGPCRTFAPTFEDAAKRHPDIVFGKVDTEAEQQLAARFRITSIPTLMVFRDGILVFAQPGALPAPALESRIDGARALDMDDVRRQRAELDAAERANAPA
ncbi:thioredoxin family protein [Glaciibacter superstes]|uniref:thioredoxin family protein n=1 Tax=Glaciibacter superstes TaxID=501023 RepID=UPI0003B2FEDC|nr:thioredoxin family protein [Glaciibacter superstes]